MARLISCAETIPAVLDGTKTQTRRLGWWRDRNGRRIIHPGDDLTICAKVMGRKPGEPLRRLAEVELIDVHRESLDEITDLDVSHEGCNRIVQQWMADNGHAVGNLRAGEMADGFIGWYCETFRCRPYTEVTVIEWRYLTWHEGPRATEATA